MNPVIAAGQQPQALPRFVQQFGLRQDATSYGDHRVGGQHVSAFELIVDAHEFERSLGLGPREAVRAGAGELAALGGFINIGWPQRIGLDACLIDQCDSPGRPGGEDEFGPADHVVRRKAYKRDCARTVEGNLLEAVGDTPPGEIVGGHFDEHFIASQHANAILSHAAGGVGDDLMFVFELHAEGGIRE